MLLLLFFFFTFLWVNSAVSWYGNIDYFTESILLPYNHNIWYTSLYYVVALCVEVPQHFDLIRLQHTLAVILVPFVIIILVVVAAIIIIIIIIISISIIIIKKKCNVFNSKKIFLVKLTFFKLN